MWDKNRIQALLQESDVAVIRAVSAIYAAQTEAERSGETTIASNGVGFNHTDARRGTYYGKYIQRTGNLTGEHLVKARKMTMKYWRQLADIANSKVVDVRVAEANRIDLALADHFREREEGEDIGNYLEEKMVAQEIQSHRKAMLSAGSFS